MCRAGIALCGVVGVSRRRTVSPGGAFIGSRSMNVVPAPGRLATVTSPPSKRASFRVTLSPRPVPPVLLVAVCSACQNGSNTFSTFSGGIPTPVSAILTSSSRRA
jgi:hypothetical protein